MAVKPGNGGGQPGNGERDPRLDRLYGDTPRETPPAHLDTVILAAARREAGARPRPLSAQLHRWRVPVSIAAVVVLSVTLVTLVREEGGDTLMGDAPSPAAPPAGRTAEPLAQPADPAEARQRTPAAAPEAFSARRDSAPKAPAEPGRAETEASAETGPATQQGTRAAPAPEADGRLRPQAAQESPRRPTRDERTSEAPPIAPRRSAVPPPAPAAASPARPMASMRAEGVAVKRLPVWHGLEQEPPQKWFERAAELKRQGRTTEAEELIVEFKRRFHDTRIPPELE